jgi:hypothetical protein
MYNGLCPELPSKGPNVAMRRLVMNKRRQLLVSVIGAILATGLLAGFGATAEARTPAIQQDIREIFLTVPVPESDLTEFAKLLGSAAQRKALLEKTDFTSDKNVLDIPNGYLRIETLFEDEEYKSEIRIVVTYFTRHDGGRLVVIQVTNLYNYPDPVVVDGFYLLGDGKYTKQEASQCLPVISFFGDFWGNQPLPAQYVRQYVKTAGDAAFYTVEWPRRGTIARAESFVPYCDTDTKEQNRIDHTLAKRQVKYLELIWDKDKGVFVKGARTRVAGGRSAKGAMKLATPF